MSSISYRADIDGLRAVAVLSVLLFHINIDFLPGGFTGVDVFFVISGYLITTILLKEISESGTISYKDFYRKRIKRILPSLFLVMGFIWILGLLILLPKDLVLLAKSSLSVITLTSNFYFSQNVDYFASNSNEFPLLHTWSLAVEEQFYILWPPLLFLLFKLKDWRYRAAVVVFAIAASITYAQIASSSLVLQKMSYFHPATRFGELLIGCLIPMILPFLKVQLHAIARHIAVWFGFIAIIVSTLVISKSSVFPGLWALAPCIGAALIIAFGGQSLKKNPIIYILSSAPFRFIGLHSYAIYLWHWPLLAFYRYYTGHQNLYFFDGLFIAALTIILSVLSRKTVEIPLNNWKQPFKPVLIRIFLIPTIGIALLAIIARDTSGFPTRINNYEKLNNETLFLSDEYCHNSSRSDCLFNAGASTPPILLFGDSHAGHFTPFWVNVLKNTSVPIYSKTADVCPPLLHRSEQSMEYILAKSGDQCLKLLKEAEEKISTSDTIIIAGEWDRYFNAIPNFAEDLSATLEKTKNKKVILMGTIPYFDKKPYHQYIRQTHSPLSNLLNLKVQTQNLSEAVHENETNRLVATVAAKFPNVIYVNPGTLATSFWKEAPFFNGLMIYRDDKHLNLYGSKEFAKQAKEEALNLLKDLPK